MELEPLPVTISLRVNGDAVRANVEPQRTLVEFLRYDLGLTGTKQGCDAGDCGACTVLLDGEPVLACLVLAADLDGAEIETVESLARGAELSPLQKAFVECGAAQCGFCTPGVLMTASALLRGSPGAPREEVRAAISGNLCRCTGYAKIVDAIESARDTIASERSHAPCRETESAERTQAESATTSRNGARS